MNQLEDSLRLVDPVDPAAPAPDGEALLREIVATPVRRRAAPRRPRARLALAGAALAAVISAVALAMPSRDDADVLAAAYAAVSQPDTILHFRVRHSMAADRFGSGQILMETEVWQAGDGSRLRSLERPQPPADPDLAAERVQTETESRTYIKERNSVIVYDTKAPPLPAPGAGGGIAEPALGDPRTLLERARSGDAKVVALGEATVRGIPVLQFRVGRCKATVSNGGTTMTYTLPVIASISRDDFIPVRIAQDNDCGDTSTSPNGIRWSDIPLAVADYVSFETLPATEENRRLLEMRPHPGARILDGEDIDAAEERSEGAAATRGRRRARPVRRPGRFG